MPGLGTTYGRGGATTSPKDLLNSDAILIMGSNMAENHPVGFQWVMEAKEKGTQVLHVDPRFSRTSAVANIWIPLRAGSDILFLGGLINYILQNELIFREYVVHYTNASVIIPEDFKDTEDLEGLFSQIGTPRRKNTIRKAGCMKELNQRTTDIIRCGRWTWATRRGRISGFE